MMTLAKKGEEHRPLLLLFPLPKQCTLRQRDDYFHAFAKDVTLDLMQVQTAPSAECFLTFALTATA